ncbi:MAG: DUF4412 domain-containing protein [Alphaproteobacteria bacterium]|nr:DUF4412 domain-containing protein [Alphaproteobacteria bacterium]
MHHLLLAAFGLLAASSAALAQDRPPVAPTRDVMVAYRATAPAQAGAQAPQGAQDIRVATTQGGRLLRVEGMGAGGAYVIVDRTTQRMVMVMPQDRRYVEMPASDAFARGFVLNESMTFVKRGAETVAGLKCTLWEVTSREGAGTACVTDDGVLLRGRGSDGKGGIEATSVKYGPQAAALFKPPADFSRLDVPPGMGQGSGPRPPGR